MVAYATYNLNAQIGGILISKNVTRSADHPNPYVPSIGKANAGVVENRTNDVLTDVDLGEDHGLTNGTYACFFSAGVRYGLTGEIAGNTLTLSDGAGDNFPANTTACQVAKVTEVNTAIDGDAVEIIAIVLEDPNTESVVKGHVQFLDAGNAQIAQIDLKANEPQFWDITGGADNPFTGNPITKCRAAQNSTASALQITIASLEDSTP
jgi:hypothetical protein